MTWTCRPAELCRRAGITASQLEHFVVVIGIIEPLHQASKPGSYRLYSDVNVVEAALAGELTTAGVTGQRLQAAFAALRAALADVPEFLRLTATFVKYVEAVKAIAAILGQTNDPAHERWARHADRLLRAWARTREPLDVHVMTLIASRATTEHANAGAGHGVRVQ